MALCAFQLGLQFLGPGYCIGPAGEPAHISSFSQQTRWEQNRKTIHPYNSIMYIYNRLDPGLTQPAPWGYTSQGGSVPLRMPLTCSRWILTVGKCLYRVLNPFPARDGNLSKVLWPAYFFNFFLTCPHHLFFCFAEPKHFAFPMMIDGILEH